MIENVLEPKQNGTIVFGLDFGMAGPIVVVVASITYVEGCGWSIKILDHPSTGSKTGKTIGMNTGWNTHGPDATGLRGAI
jgi:hypothetical protein